MISKKKSFSSFYASIETPTESKSEGLYKENLDLKIKIKELQKAVEKELQQADNQFLEKIEQMKEEHARKVEELGAFSFLAAQDAEVFFLFFFFFSFLKITNIITKLN